MGQTTKTNNEKASATTTVMPNGKKQKKWWEMWLICGTIVAVLLLGGFTWYFVGGKGSSYAWEYCKSPENKKTKRCQEMMAEKESNWKSISKDGGGDNAFSFH